MSRKHLNWPIFALAALLTVVAIVLGGLLAQEGRFDQSDNLLFEADCKRVIENSTTLSGPQERARIHPLHVLFFAPVGQLLSLLLGSAKLATVVITAICAAVVILNVDRVLRLQLELPVSDRLLFAALLGASSSQVTFAMVPDTHILSAVGLSGMASALTPLRLERLRAQHRSYLDWLRSGGVVSLGWAVLAVGMLGTSLLLVPAMVLLQQPTSLRLSRRLFLAALGTVTVFAVVLGLHAAQRAVWPPVPPAEVAALAAPQMNVGTPTPSAHAGSETPPESTAPTTSTQSSAPKPISLRNLGSYARETWMHNSRWLTPSGMLHERLAQVVLAVFSTTFFAPRFELYQRSWSALAAASFEPWPLDHRWTGFVGLGAWLVWLAGLGLALKGAHASLAKPLLWFSSATILFYAGVVFFYGDELFLYSPNWAFAVVLVAAALYAPVRSFRKFRFGLAVIVACLFLNSVSYTAELLRHFL
jgi:hypothetical protein